MKNRFTVIVDVHLFLIDNGKILLLKRANTGYQDGNFSVIAGHHDGNEPLTSAIRRETKEEIGVEIEPENIRVVHVMHNKSNSERVAFFFETKLWKGMPQNMEPNLCAELRWAFMEDLPLNMVPYVRHSLENYHNNIFYSEFGW